MTVNTTKGLVERMVNSVEYDPTDVRGALDAIDRFKARLLVHDPSLSSEMVQRLSSEVSTNVYMEMVDETIRAGPAYGRALSMLLAQTTMVERVKAERGQYVVDEWLEDAVKYGFEGTVIDELMSAALSGDEKRLVRGRLARAVRDNEPLSSLLFVYYDLQL